MIIDTLKLGWNYFIQIVESLSEPLKMKIKFRIRIKLSFSKHFKKFKEPSNVSSKKSWSPPPNTFDTQTIIKHRLEMGKSQPPKVKGVKNSTKQTSKHYKG
jgi:hypothetical protein